MPSSPSEVPSESQEPSDSAVPSARRFVVLRHEPGPNSVRTGQTHFDWMFQQATALSTWATTTIPLWESDRPWEEDCVALPDHRSDYLTYEGEVSGDRGNVARLVAGTYRTIISDPDRKELQIEWTDTSAESLIDPRRAVLVFHRNVSRTERSGVDETRVGWRLRFLPG